MVKYMVLALCLIFFTTSQVSSEDKVHNKDGECHPNIVNIDSVPTNSDPLDITKQTIQINFGKTVINLCANEESVNVINKTDSTITSFTCEDMASKENNGIGYYPNNIGQHIWFLVTYEDGQDMGKTQFGIYRENRPDLWLVSTHSCSEQLQDVEENSDKTEQNVSINSAAIGNTVSTKETVMAVAPTSTAKHVDTDKFSSSCAIQSRHISKITNTDNLDIENQAVQFQVGNKLIEVCASKEFINVSNLTDENERQFSCDEMANVENGGAGYYPMDIDFYMWYFVNRGKESKNLVQIGILELIQKDGIEEGITRSWFVTGYTC